MGRFQLSLRGLMILVFVCVFIAWVGRGIQNGREAAKAAQCVGNLSQIGLALHNYHSDYGCFPPAYIADAHGRPMHSWRILILPYMDQQAVFDAYDFNEPWNGPNNSQLAPLIPGQFMCPNGGGRPLTNFVAVAGPPTAFPGGKSSSLGEFLDGPESTVLLVESTEANIHWMEPRDLAPQSGLSSDHQRGAAVLFADGRVKRVVLPASQDVIRAWSTISGHELISTP